MKDLFFIAVWFVVCFALSYVFKNSPHEKRKNIAICSLFTICPFILVPVFFTITPKVKED